MPMRVAGEKKLWNGGLLTDDVYLSLHDGPYASAANEFQASESSGARYAQNYARQPMSLSDWTEDAATGSRSNTAAAAWSAPGSGNDWPGALSVGVWSAAADGDLLVDEQIVGAPALGTSSAPVTFAAGRIVFDI